MVDRLQTIVIKTKIKKKTSTRVVILQRGSRGILNEAQMNATNHSVYDELIRRKKVRQLLEKDTRRRSV